jgi:hypothetical protein
MQKTTQVINGSKGKPISIDISYSESSIQKPIDSILSRI